MPFVECFSLGIGQLLPTIEGNTVSLGSFFCPSHVYHRCVLASWNDFLPCSDGLAGLRPCHFRNACRSLFDKAKYSWRSTPHSSAVASFCESIRFWRISSLNPGPSSSADGQSEAFADCDRYPGSGHPHLLDHERLVPDLRQLLILSSSSTYSSSLSPGVIVDVTPSPLVQG